jgi:hypothetical protein
MCLLATLALLTFTTQISLMRLPQKKWQIPAMSMWIDMFTSFNSDNKYMCSFIRVTFYWYLVKNIQFD